MSESLLSRFDPDPDNDAGLDDAGSEAVHGVSNIHCVMSDSLLDRR